jgi:uncharacterized membrane protein
MKLFVQIYIVCFPALWTLSRIDDSDLQLWVPYVAAFMAILDLAARRSFKSPALFLAMATVMESFRHESSVVLWYPVIANIVLLSVFAASFRSETIVERIASRKETLSDEARRYCRAVTGVWCCFFVINGCIAFYTILAEDVLLWGFYNGFVSYCLIATIFAVEYAVRRRVAVPRLLLHLGIFLHILAHTSVSVSAEALDSLSAVVRTMTGETQSRTPIKFVQYRTLRGLSKPIVSHGALTIDPGRELVWELLSPMQATVRITAEGIQESVNGSSGRIHNDPFYSEFARLLLLLHGGSLTEIEKVFESHITSSSNGFTVTLKPRRRALRKALLSIEIQGACQPKQISMNFTEGDSVKIVFQNNDSPCPIE